MHLTVRLPRGREKRGNLRGNGIGRRELREGGNRWARDVFPVPRRGRRKKEGEGRLTASPTTRESQKAAAMSRFPTIKEKRGGSVRNDHAGSERKRKRRAPVCRFANTPRS